MKSFCRGCEHEWEDKNLCPACERCGKREEFLESTIGQLVFNGRDPRELREKGSCWIRPRVDYSTSDSPF